MNLQTSVKIEKFRAKIDYKSVIFMVGSCFSANIGEKLQKSKFSALFNPLGTIYNPRSVVDTLLRVERGDVLSEKDLFFTGELYGSFVANTLFSSKDPIQTLCQINSAIHESHEYLMNSNFVIITLGTSYCYYLKEGGGAVTNCHKFPASMFDRKMLSHEQTEHIFAEILEREFYKGKNIIFTISPVRYLRDGLGADSVSKSHLRIAVDNMVQKYENVSYFPSYEIFNDELRDYRFYGDDLVHPSTLGVEYVWERFVEELVDVDSQQIMKQVAEVMRNFSHRAVNPNSDTYRKFIKATIEKAEKLEKSHEGINFDREKGCI